MWHIWPNKNQMNGETMFKQETVFIVGAGASAEAGLPIGSQLAGIIAKSLFFEVDDFGSIKNTDSTLLNAWKRHLPQADLNRHLLAARQIHEGIEMVRSIDNYLHIHETNEQVKFCGKTAIVHAILQAERNSLLMTSERNPNSLQNIDQLKNTWYMEFVKQLMEGRQASDLENVFDEISIICFNYDRCIPHFLRFAIKSLYSISLEKAERIVAKLEIHHPYGTVGPLQTMENRNGVQFGSSDYTLRLAELSEGIKTFTEQVDDKEKLEKIKDTILNANHLIFLGFGFHEQNMNILEPFKKEQPKTVYATAFGMSESNTIEIEARIKKLGRGSPRKPLQIKNDLNCAELFRHFQMSL